MANSKGQIVVLLIIVAALGGLGVLIFRPKHPPAELPQPAQGQLSNDLDLDFYVDGSGSMKNFLDAGDGAGEKYNYLHHFLVGCDSRLWNPPAESGWNGLRPKFWRFGAHITELPREGVLTKLTDHPNGFTDDDGTQVPGFNESKTSIELAVNHTRPDHRAGAHKLKIIVTDLYETNGANVIPAEGLVKQYLQNTGAVAIYAIRNPYTGNVEDLPALKGKSLPKGAADTMPFYIIVAGENAADVYHAQEVLMSGATGEALGRAFEQHRALQLYFSKDPGWRYTNLTSRNLDWKVDKADLGIGDPAPKPGPNSIPLLVLRGGKVKVTLPWPQQVLDKTGRSAPDRENLQVRTIIKSGNKPNGDHAARKAVTADFCPGAARAICATIDRGRFPEKGTYLVEFQIVATHPSNELDTKSDTISKWSIEDDEELDIADRGQKFPKLPGVPGEHPGRTPNLMHFLTSLEGRVYEVNDVDKDPVRVATYDLYVEAGR